MTPHVEIATINSIEALDNARMDDAVAIPIKPLVSPNLSCEQPVYYCAKVDRQIQAHVHLMGDEIYYVVSGAGELFVSNIQCDDQGIHTLGWTSYPVFTGDVFVIPASVAHSLKNKGAQPLILHFLCNPMHLADDIDGGDRHLVENP